MADFQMVFPPYPVAGAPNLRHAESRPTQRKLGRAAMQEYLKDDGRDIPAIHSLSRRLSISKRRMRARGDWALRIERIESRSPRSGWADGGLEYGGGLLP